MDCEKCENFEGYNGDGVAECGSVSDKCPYETNDKEDEKEMEVPQELMDVLETIAEDLEKESTVQIDTRTYEKLITAKVVLGILSRDIRHRKKGKETGEVPSYKDTVDGDFIERIIGTAYNDDHDRIAEIIDDNDKLSMEVDALRKFIREHPQISEEDKVGIGAFQEEE